MNRRTFSAVHIVLAVLSAIMLVNEARSQADKDDWPKRIGFGLHRKPALSVYYGFTQSSLQGLLQPLADPRYFELKIGGTSENLEIEESNVVSYRYNYFSLVNISTGLGSQATPGEITTDLWRLGVSSEKGYGYSLGDSSSYRSLLLYNSDGMNWSRLDVTGAVVHPSDSALLNLYDGTFRFGTKMEGGVKVRFIPLMMIDAGYERAIVFRRHLFWKWVGSIALEGAVNWALDRFIDKVLESSPAAVPIVNFVLKNGLSYGIYQLRKEKMNYPFDSESPLLYDTFKIGLTFVF